MFNGGSNGGYSLSDIAAVSNGRNGNGWGDQGSWWIIVIIIIAAMWGNGNGGLFGGGDRDRGNGSSGGTTVIPYPVGGFGTPSVQGALTRGDLCSEFSFNDLQNGVRGIQQGICSLGYDQLSQMNGINANIAALNSNLNNAVCTLGYQTQASFAGLGTQLLQSQNEQTIASMQNQNALQAQIADCCCTQKGLIRDTQYQMATDTCAVNTNLANSTRDIVDSQNANTRAILDAIQQSRVEALQEKIEALREKNTQLAFQASQSAQNEYLVSQLKPCPVPAYLTCNPWGNTVQYGTCNCNG